MTHTPATNYWLSIGRNVGAEPMNATDWRYFCHELARIAGRHGSTITSVRGGVAQWDGNDEDTFLLLVTIPARNVARIRKDLARLARDYEQDAIGFVGGNDDGLVTP
jgi:hypothetical protein